MTNITPNKDTEERIELLLALIPLGQKLHKRIAFLKDVVDEITPEDKKIIDDEIDKIMEIYVPSVCNIYTHLLELETKFGGGWTDIGPSRALRLLSEKDFSLFNLESFLNGFQVLINKFVLLDSHRTGQDALVRTNQIYSKFSGKRRVA